MGTVRFLLALAVVADHSPGAQLLGHGLLSAITAVQAFYVISGFLITMILNERQQYRSLTNFYVSRYLRLWPPYIVVALLTLYLQKWNMETSQLLLTTPLTWLFIWFSNISLLFQDWFCFLRLDGGHLYWTAAFRAAPIPRAVDYLLVPQCWSIGVEMTFYLIAPLVCRKWWGAVALFAFGACCRLLVAGWPPPDVDPWRYRFAPAEMMMFGCGAISYFVGRAVLRRLTDAHSTAIGRACLASLSVIILGDYYTDPAINFIFNDCCKIIFLADAPILFFVAFSCPFLFWIGRKSRIDDFLGELSYPIYVTHLVLVTELYGYLPPALRVGNLFLTLLVIAASAGVFFCIVVPTDRLRRRFGARVPLSDFAVDAVSSSPEALEVV